MIKLKLKEILNIYNSLYNNMDGISDIVVKFKFLAILNELKKTYDLYINLRQDLILKYGNKNEDGDIVIDTNNEDVMNNFNHDIEKLLDQEISVQMDKLKFKDICNVNVDILMALYPIIEE